MSFGGDEGSEIGYSTARGRDWPSVRQFNVFLENRLGALLNVVRRFETTDIRIVSLTVVDSADCAIVRMVLSDPERALEIFLERAGKRHVSYGGGPMRVHADGDENLYGRGEPVQPRDSHRDGRHDGDLAERGRRGTHGHERDRVDGHL